MELVRAWYAVLSQLSAAVAEPVGALASGLDVPVLSALLFGVIGATAPCQLSTNLSAIAYVSGRLETGHPGLEALAYTAGKILVYTLLGAVAVAVGLGVQAAAVPVVVVARKLLGPLMLLMGLVFLGWLRVRGSAGDRVMTALRGRRGPRGAWGAFLLGTAFGFAFCPTLFLLFFGLAIPLAVGTGAGWLVPGAFAVGTALPLLGYATLLATGQDAARASVERLSRAYPVVRRVAGGVLLLAGLNDTVTYWAL